MQVIRDLNKEQHCQYILVTHSESLINSSTINHVKRFSRDNEGNTVIKSPVLSADEKTLIKILDNTRSTYAFFAKKVLLVEGDTDRYFFKSAIQLKCPEMDQEIAVLYMGGKNNYPEWSKLFESFGLTVYCIADLDFLFDTIYTTETSISLKTAEAVTGFKHDHLDWQKKILECYRKRIYILRNGDLEHYLRIRGR